MLFQILLLHVVLAAAGVVEEDMASNFNVTSGNLKYVFEIVRHGARAPI